MQVTFQLVMDDLRKLSNYLRQNNGGNASRVLSLIVMVCFFSGLIFSVWTGLHQHNGRVDEGLVLEGLVPAVVVAIYLPLLYRSGIQRRKTDPLLTHPQTVHINPDGVRVITVDSDTTHKWFGIHDIGSDDNGLYFFFTKEQAFMVPGRAFTTPDDAQVFLRTATAYWQGKAPAQGDGADAATWPPPPQTLKS